MILKTKLIVKYVYPTGIKKCEILTVNTQSEEEKDNTNPTLILTWRRRLISGSGFEKISVTNAPSPLDTSI